MKVQWNKLRRKEKQEYILITLDLTRNSYMWQQKFLYKQQKMEKLDFIKIKNLWIKSHYKESKKTTTEWRAGNILNQVFDKSLVSTYIKRIVHFDKLSISPL